MFFCIELLNKNNLFNAPKKINMDMISLEIIIYNYLVYCKN